MTRGRYYLPLWVGQERRLSHGAPGSLWTIDIDDVLAVFEYTTDGGPWHQDWFVAFVVSPDGEWVEGAVDAEAGQAVRWFGAHHGERLDLGLCGSTDWASRGLWPPELRDAPVMHAVPPPPPTARLSRWLWRTAFCSRWMKQWRLRPEVLALLRARGEARAVTPRPPADRAVAPADAEDMERILAPLRAAGAPLQNLDLADRLGLDRRRVARLLRRLAVQQRVGLVGRPGERATLWAPVPG
ncbi:MAG: hypothetical protein AB7O97_20670 [Planctomycetota bacterium]